MEELYEFNGKQYSRAELEKTYGDKTDSAIEKFGITKVEGDTSSNTPQEPAEAYSFNGKTYSRAELEKTYGDKTDKVIKDYNFKKKSSSQPMESSTKEGSTVGKAGDGRGGNYGDNPNANPVRNTPQDGQKEATLNTYAISKLDDPLKTPEQKREEQFTGSEILTPENQAIKDKEDAKRKAAERQATEMVAREAKQAKDNEIKALENQFVLKNQEDFASNEDVVNITREIQDKYASAFNALPEEQKTQEEADRFSNDMRAELSSDPRIKEIESNIVQSNTDDYYEKAQEVTGRYYGNDKIELLDEEIANLLTSQKETNNTTEIENINDELFKLRLQRSKLKDEKGNKYANDKGYTYKLPDGTEVTRSEFIKYTKSYGFEKLIEDVQDGEDVKTTYTNDPDVNRFIASQIYNKSTRGSFDGLAEVGVDILGGTAASPYYVGEFISRTAYELSKAVGNPDEGALENAEGFKELIATESEWYKDLKESVEDKYQREWDLLDVYSEGGAADFTKELLKETAKQLPNTLAIGGVSALTGGMGGFAYMSLMTAANERKAYIEDEKQKEEQVALLESEGKNEEAQKVRETIASDRNAVFGAGVKGLTEGALESIQLNVMKNVTKQTSKLAASLSSSARSRGMNDAVDVIKNQYKQIGVDLINNTVQESGSEMATTLIQDYTDAISKGVEYDADASLRNSAISGLVTLPMTLVPSGANVVLNSAAYLSTKAKAETELNESVLNGINEEIALKGSSKTLEKQKKRALDNIIKIENEQIGLNKAATPEERKDIADISEEINEIDNSIKEVSGDVVLSLETQKDELIKNRDALLQNIEKDYENIEQQTPEKSSKPSEKLDKETVQETDTFTEDKQAEKVNTEVDENGNIDLVEDIEENKQANEKLTEQDNTEQEPSIEAIESKAESTSEAELNEVIKEVDKQVEEAIGVERKNLSDVETDETRFQGRDGLNEDVVNDIAVNWNDADQDPIHVWTDPKNGKTYVLSGHHRFAAAKLAGKDNVKTVDRSADFNEKQAIKFATEEANANRTMETPLERSNTLRKKRENGDSKEDIETFLKREGKNKTRILNLSFLNPKGIVTQMLKSFEKNPDVETQNEIERIADWIGDARKRNKKLTDAHEKELFDFLNNKEQSKRFTNKADFLSKVNSLTGEMFFDATKPLNIARFKNQTEGEKQYDKEVSEQKEVISKLEEKEKSLRDRFNNPNNENYIDPNASDYDVMKERANGLQKQIESDLKIERAKLLDIYKNKGKYNRAGINQIGMFDTLTEPTPKEQKPKVVNDATEGIREEKPLTAKEKSLKDRGDKFKEKVQETKDDFRERFEEYVDSTKQKFKDKLDAEREKGKEAVLKAKGKIAEKAVFEKTKSAQVEVINRYLKDFKNNRYFPSELASAISNVSNAKTLASLNKAISRVKAIVDKSARRNDLSNAKKLSDRVKGSLGRRVGFNPEYIAKVKDFLGMEAKYIPQSIMGDYLDLLTEISKKGFKESIDATKTEIDKIVDAAAKHKATFEKVKVKFLKSYDNSMSLAQNIANQKKEGNISFEEAELLKTFKDEFKEELSEQEKEALAKEKEESQEEERLELANSNKTKLKGISPLNIQFSKANKDVGRANRGLVEIIKKLSNKDVDGMSLAQQKALNKALDAIDLGIVNNDVYKVARDVEAMKRDSSLDKNNLKGASWSNFVKKAKKGLGVTNKSATTQKIEGTALRYIDQTLGLIKGSAIYEAFFDGIASATEKLKVEFDKRVKHLDEVVGDLGARNSDDRWVSSAKIKMYEYQLMHETNPDSKTNPPLEDLVKETVKPEGLSSYSNESKTELSNIFEGLKVDGEITADGIFGKLTTKEKKVAKALQDARNEVRDKSEFSSSVYRGETLEFKENYTSAPIHGGDSKKTSVEDFKNKLFGISTKAKSANVKTSGAKAVSFDAIGDTRALVKETLTDFYLTPEISTLNKLSKTVKSEEGISVEQLDVLDAIVQAKDDLLENIFNVEMKDDTAFRKATQWLKKKGYMTMLVGLARPIAELASNTYHAVASNRTVFEKGIKITSKYSDELLSELSNSVGATETSRFFGAVDMNSKMVDQGLFESSKGERRADKPSAIKSGVSGIVEAAAKLDEFIDESLGATVSVSDKIVGKRVWVGEMFIAFEKLTGEVLNPEKAVNDENYRDKFSKELKESRRAADRAAADSVASTNKAAGILNNQKKPEGAILQQVLQSFDSFMTNFRKFEFESAKKAYTMMSKAESKEEFRNGAALMAATLGRMVIYDMLKTYLSAKIIGGLIGFSDDDDDDTFAQKFTNSITGTAFTLFVGRNFGNIQLAIFNQILESANKEYGEGIMYSGDYNMYQNSLAYTAYNAESDDAMTNLAINMSGAYSPILRRMAAYNRKFSRSKSEAQKEQLRFDASVEIASFVLSLPREGMDAYKKNMFLKSRGITRGDGSSEGKEKSESASKVKPIKVRKVKPLKPIKVKPIKVRR